MYKQIIHDTTLEGHYKEEEGKIVGEITKGSQTAKVI